tara:strand:+ start:35 stop:739 length:705 start_codon:yes stop_codon:yes gene_type:complete
MATTKIRSSSITDGQVANADLSATVAVTGGQIADDAVTLAKMAGLARGKIIVGDASGDPSALTVGAANQVLKSDGSDVSWGADSGGLFSGYAIFCDQKTLGTDGGTFTSGAWRVRDLNTTIANTDTTNIALGTNEFTLQAGSYYIKWNPVAGQPNMGSNQSGLHDGSSFIQMGKSMYNWTATSDSCGFVRVTPGSATTYTIQHRCETTTTTTGFGRASDFAVEIYTVVEIFKEA